jgi:hypothetical protein
MSTLTIRKKSLKTWLHTDSILGDFIISKFYFNADNVSFQIVEQGQSKRVIYDITDITLYALPSGGSAETFTTITQLSLRLEELNYPAFQYDGQITSIANLIDEGTGVTITGDGTEANPYVISATGGGGGVPTLDQVLTEGNTSDKSIILDEGAGGFRMAMDFGSTIISITENSSGNLGYLSESGMVTRNATNTIFGEYGKGYMQLKTTATSGIANIKGTNLTSNRNYELPNASGTIALTSDIPTIDATPTDGSANAVSSNGVFDALALRKKVIVSDVTSATVTGTTSLTLAKTYEVTAGTLSASGFLNLFMYASRTGASNSYTMGIYINTSNNFGTATLITSIATSGNFSPFLPFKAQYVLKNNLLIGGISNQTSGSNYVNSITQVSVACNNTSNSVWLFIGITPTNSGSSIVVEGVEILN